MGLAAPREGAVRVGLRARQARPLHARVRQRARARTAQRWVESGSGWAAHQASFLIRERRQAWKRRRVPYPALTGDRVAWNAGLIVGLAHDHHRPRLEGVASRTSGHDRSRPRLVRLCTGEHQQRADQPGPGKARHRLHAWVRRRAARDSNDTNVQPRRRRCR